MELSNNDQAFIEYLKKVSKNNKENDEKKVVVTNKALLSENLLSLFDIDTNSSGGWFFNVYVEFVPMFNEKEAESWQV